jgi:signal transduction histidine kinase
VPVVVHGEVVGVHGVAEDVTERNGMRRELERTRRAAEEANAAKSLFLANMSHEVRTPLTSVLGATEMLAEDDLGPSQHYLVGIIHRSGERLLRLVNDILDVSRLEAGTLDVQRAPLKVRSLVDDVVAWGMPMAHEEGLDFDWAIDPALPETVLGDAMRINQVVTNLLGNAFKFTEEGQVQLRVNVAGSRGGVVDVRFSVTDSGIGIEHDQLASLFQSFTQVDTSTTRKYGGAGLGLAICQELVTLMGGYLDADSTMGVGSTFRFTVPLSVDPAAD